MFGRRWLPTGGVLLARRGDLERVRVSARVGSVRQACRPEAATEFFVTILVA